MNLQGHYILNGTIPVPIFDLLEWTMWMATDKKRVGWDTIEGVQVSTVFLGIDFGIYETNPLLFETMVFTDIEGGGKTLRYRTWEEALEGHNAAVKEIRINLAQAKANGIKALDSVMNATQQEKGNE